MPYCKRQLQVLANLRMRISARLPAAALIRQRCLKRPQTCLTCFFPDRRGLGGQYAITLKVFPFSYSLGQHTRVLIVRQDPVQDMRGPISDVLVFSRPCSSRASPGVPLLHPDHPDKPPVVVSLRTDLSIASLFFALDVSRSSLASALRKSEVIALSGAKRV